MPLFEYRCSDCDSKFEILHKSQNNDYKVECPECKSAEVKKLISSFSTSGLQQNYNSSVSDDSCDTGTCGCSSGFCGLN
jgi:putative FmdB family regulatory protein